jgi:hypothetical protein
LHLRFQSLDPVLHGLHAIQQLGRVLCGQVTCEPCGCRRRHQDAPQYGDPQNVLLLPKARTAAPDR